MKEKIAPIGGIVTAFLAGSCCLGPVLFLAFGVTGLGFLSKLEWLRPYFLVLTVIFAGIAYHYAYGKGSHCGPDETCNPKTNRINKILFWAVVCFAVFGAGFPYAAAWLYG